MKKKSTARSAFFTPRGLATLIVCTAACFIVAGAPLAFLRSEAPTKWSQRTLTFAERVAYQRAIEDVSWRHRISPKDRPNPKPSLDAVMSQAQLEKKVADYLRKSQALEDYWHRPITADQLQAEMDRMARHTRQPDILRELFAALGDDPFVIAECLARPAIADGLLSNWYSHDERIHGELKQRTQADLLVHPSVEQMKQLSGNYSVIELIRSDGGHEENRRAVGQGVQELSRRGGMKRCKTWQQCSTEARRRPLPLECGEISRFLKALTCQRTPKTLPGKNTKPSRWENLAY